MLKIVVQDNRQITPARKIPLRERVKDAWAVLTGKAHAVSFFPWK